MSTLTPNASDTSDVMAIEDGAVGGDTEGRELSRSSSNVNMGMQDLLPLFECPVCYDFILPPISQCSQGHLICSSCKEKVNRCPTCREELGSIRCLFMEKVAENLLFPCKYSVNGCDKTLSRAAKTQHELDECPYKLYNCPYRFIDTCGEFIGTADSLVLHLLNAHNENYRKEHGHAMPHCGSEASFVPFVNVVDYKIDNSSTSWMWTFIQSYREKTFVINLYYVHNGDYNLHFVTVRLVGTKVDARKFKYEVIFYGPSGAMTYTGCCRSMHEEVRGIYEARDCLSFDRITALRYLVKLPGQLQDGQRKKILKFCIRLTPA